MFLTYFPLSEPHLHDTSPLSNQSLLLIERSTDNLRGDGEVSVVSVIEPASAFIHPYVKPFVRSAFLPVVRFPPTSGPKEKVGRQTPTISVEPLCDEEWRGDAKIGVGTYVMPAAFQANDIVDVWGGVWWVRWV
jgi:hypothetical protein